MNIIIRNFTILRKLFAIIASEKSNFLTFYLASHSFLYLRYSAATSSWSWWQELLKLIITQKNDPKRSIKNLTFSTWTWRETCSSLKRKPTELTTKRWMQNAKNIIKIIVLRQVYIAEHIFPSIYIKFFKFYRLRVVSTSGKRVGERRARLIPQTHQRMMRQTRDVRWAIFQPKLLGILTCRAYEF